jgi:hypothetical protein
MTGSNFARTLSVCRDRNRHGDSADEDRGKQLDTTIGDRPHNTLLPFELANGSAPWAPWSNGISVRTFFPAKTRCAKFFRDERALARKPVNYLPERATRLVFLSARDKRSETSGPDLARIMNRSKGVENFLVMPTEH